MKSNRIWEIIPGLSVWMTLILPIILAFYLPNAVSIFILFYIILWLLRSFSFAFFLIKGYLKTRRYITIDWGKHINIFENEKCEDEIKNMIPDTQNIINELYSKYKTLKSCDHKKAEDVYHIVIVPTYKEDINVLRSSFNGIANANYDKNKIIVVLATEERDHKRAEENGEIIKKEFKDSFKELWIIEHPKNIPNELACKGSNIYYAGHEVKKRIEKMNIDPASTIITTIDADNIVHPNYLPALTMHYIAEPDRKKRSYQSLPLFFNNIWNVPMLNRIVALSSSFWHIIQSGRADRLRNFAAHSQPMDALIEMDFWNKNNIVEDGHQFWRSYFHFNGNYKVIPLFMPIYQDAVESETYWETLKDQYLQLRRWAWGSTDISFSILKSWEMRKELPVLRTIRRVFILVEGHYMWATTPLVLLMATPVPRYINKDFSQSVTAYNMNLLLGNFFRFALVGIFVSLGVSMIMLPKHPKGWKGRASSMIMWLLLPVTTVIFGALPAIDAQTRLMFNKRLDFNVTKKVRKSVE